MLILRAGRAERDGKLFDKLSTQLLIISHEGTACAAGSGSVHYLYAYVHTGFSPEIKSRGVWAESKALDRCMQCGAHVCLPSLAAGHLDRLV